MTSKPTSPKTFFLVPGWGSPKTSITLGSVIANPMQPKLAIFRPEKTAPGFLRTAVTDTISATVKPEFTVTGAAAVADGGDDGLFRTFLRLYGLGDEESFHYDRKSVLSYSARGLESDSFAPGDALKWEAVEAERVAQFLRTSDHGASVFMVTGVKTVRGAGVTTRSGKGSRWRVALSVGLGDDDIDDDDDDDGPVVFAFELDELKVSFEGDMTVTSVGVGHGETVEALQGRLDRDFGEATFTVIEGFDEENGAECKIVASSPAYVDLLTAGSARINLSRLNSPSIRW